MDVRFASVAAAVCTAGVIAWIHVDAASLPSTTVAHTTGPGSATSVVTTRATVEDVDEQSRIVTLRTADDRIVHFRADPSMRNLPQVRKGDEVSATYYESMAIRLRDADGEQPRVSMSEKVERAPLGKKPGGMIVRDTTLTAKVTGIDKARRTVTLEGPHGGTVMLTAEDPTHLDDVRVGHLVEATYREGVSISVRKPEK